MFVALSTSVIALASPSMLRAQQGLSAYPEFRADAIVATAAAAQGGVGIVVPAGVYVRIGFDGAAGAVWHDGASSAEGRVDAIARFLLDPLRENNMALSVGGGLSVPIRRDGVKTPLLAVVMDLEGRRRGGLTPALEVGLGGGARVGIVLRRSPPRWR